MVVTLTVEMDTVDLRNAEADLVTGRHVATVQGLLRGTRRPEWDPGPIDGLGGPRTRRAVVAFQADNGLDADAIVGPITWGDLIPHPRFPPEELPPDERGRSEPVDATPDFAAIGPQASFEVLIAEVVAAVEERWPARDAEGGVITTDVAAPRSGGTILVRRPIFGDDSIAGFEYTVATEHSSDGWVVTSATRSAICRRGVSGGLCV